MYIPNINRRSNRVSEGITSSLIVYKSQSQQEETYKHGNSETTATNTRTNPYTGQFGNTYNQVYEGYRNLMNQPLGTTAAPSNIYSNTFDPVVQNAISKGIQGIKQQQTTQGYQTANALNTAGAGNNSALLGVLNRQSLISGGAAANALPAMGAEQQRAYDLAREQARIAANADVLAQRNAKVNTLAQGNSLLNALIGMGGITGTTTAEEKKKYEDLLSSSIWGQKG